MLDYLVVFGVAFTAVAVLTPLLRRLALRFNVAVDRPAPRKIHSRPTPRVGGVAVFAGVIAAIGIARALPTFEGVFTETSEPEAILLASVVVVGIGLLDDTRGVSAPAKLAAQILAAGILVLFGFRLLFVYIPGQPGSVVSLSPDLGALLTIAAIVAMINAVNLVDGLDGLAAGITAIAAVSLFCYALLADPMAVGLASSATLMLAAVAGAALGFLLHNFHPASIFMGDSGAYLLGLMLAASGVSAIQGTIQPSRSAFAAFSVPVLVPAIVLAVPFLDTIWTVLRRLRAGGGVFHPDKRHLHHRLVELGHSQRRAVLIMYYWSALAAFAGVGVGLLELGLVVAIVAVGIVVPAVLWGVGALRRRRAAAAEPATDFVHSFTKVEPDDSETPPDQEKRRDSAL